MAMVATPQSSLKDLVDNFTPGGCYGIEWELRGDELKKKGHYNPEWRIEGVKAKGLVGLYTEESAAFEFQVGHGVVGKAFEEQKVLFVKDLQDISADSVMEALQTGDGVEFQRADLAKKYSLRSAIFLPSATGVLEIGSAQSVKELPEYFAPYANTSTPAVATEPALEMAWGRHTSPADPPRVLVAFVESLARSGSYGIEWVCHGDSLKYRSHYNPPWREEAVRRQGLQGLFTTESIGYTFGPGEGLVGAAFATQQMSFIRDLSSVSPEEAMAAFHGATTVFMRKQAATDYGIHSAFFLPSPDGILEVGSTQISEDFLDFLSDEAGAGRQGVSTPITAASTAPEVMRALRALAA